MNNELYALTHDTSKCTARLVQLVEMLRKWPEAPSQYQELILETAKELNTIIDTYYKSQQ